MAAPSTYLTVVRTRRSMMPARPQVYISLLLGAIHRLRADCWNTSTFWHAEACILWLSYIQKLREIYQDPFFLKVISNFTLAMASSDVIRTSPASRSLARMEARISCLLPFIGWYSKRLEGLPTGHDGSRSCAIAWRYEDDRSVKHSPGVQNSTGNEKLIRIIQHPNG